MAMSKLCFYAALSFIMLSCSHPVYTNLWQAKPVNVDGDDAEWAIPLRFYDNTSKLQYTVTNDNSNLYLCIRATDEQSQAKIIRAGMQVWIDTTGKNKHQVGILYPISNPEKGAKPSTASHSMEKRLTELNDVQLTGFKASVAGLTSVLDHSAVNLKMKMDNKGILIYELMIPFKTFYKETLSPSDSSKVMGLTIIVNGWSMQKNAGRSGGGGSGMRGGAGGGMRGGRGRSSMGGGMANYNEFAEANKVKMKLKLITH